jgi:hypothetical protein
MKSANMKYPIRTLRKISLIPYNLGYEINCFNLIFRMNDVKINEQNYSRYEQNWIHAIIFPMMMLLFLNMKLGNFNCLLLLL